MHTLTMPDGAILAYQDSDPGAGRAAVSGVCLHGWAMSGRWFDVVAQSLSESVRVLVPDQRGHGESGLGSQDLTIELLAKDLGFFLQETQVERVILVGWSMGAMVAWKAIDAGLSTPLLGLVVIDMTPKILNDQEWTNGMAGTDFNTSTTQLDHRGCETQRLWNETCRKLANRIVASNASESSDRLVRQLAADALGNDPVAMRGLWQSMLVQDFRALISKAPIPTLVTYGARSQLYPSSVSAFIVETAPNASRKAFLDSGHAPHLEQPKEFDRSLHEFVTTRGQSFAAGANENSKPSE